MEHEGLLEMVTDVAEPLKIAAYAGKDMFLSIRNPEEIGHDVEKRVSKYVFHRGILYVVGGVGAAVASGGTLPVAYMLGYTLTGAAFDYYVTPKICGRAASSATRAVRFMKHLIK